MTNNSGSPLWPPLELLRHLTLGDEHYWLSSIVGAEDIDWVPTGPRACWRVGLFEARSFAAAGL